jgi:hypothetical protein
MPSRSKKDNPKKLASRMKRRWRVVLLRHKGEILGEVEAADVAQPRRPRRTGLIWTKSSATGYAPELIGAVHTSFYWGVSTEAQREHSG